MSQGISGKTIDLIAVYSTCCIVVPNFFILGAEGEKLSFISRYP